MGMGTWLLRMLELILPLLIPSARVPKGLALVKPDQTLSIDVSKTINVSNSLYKASQPEINKYLQSKSEPQSLCIGQCFIRYLLAF